MAHANCWKREMSNCMKTLLTLCVMLCCQSGTPSYGLVLQRNTPEQAYLHHPNVPMNLILNDLERYDTHVVVQAHSQWQNITLVQNGSQKASVTGRHVGLVTLIWYPLTSLSWQLSLPVDSDNVTVLIVATVYNRTDAIPGGCNMELPLYIDPNLFMHTRFQQNHVQFGYANVWQPSGALVVENCGDQQFISKLSYDLYLLWLEERDLSYENYAENLRNKMLFPKDIVKHGTKVSSMWYNHGQTQMNFAAYRRQGVIYNVIVKYKRATGITTEIAHVPMVTYSCDQSTEGCSSPSVGSYVYFLILAIFGLLLCLRGHRLFYLEIFLLGSFAVHIICFILISTFSSLDFYIGLYVSWAPGLVGGSLWLLLWLCAGIPMLTVLMPALTMGYVFSSILFNITPLGGLSWWDSPFNYAMGFCCGVLVVPVLLLAHSRVLNIVSCAVVGSYLVVVAIDVFLEGSIRHILLNSYRKAVLPSFLTAYDGLPFQASDIGLCVLWVVLCVGGAGLQLYLERNRPHFPPHPWFRLKRQELQRRREANVNVPQGGIDDEDDERTPLLGGAREPQISPVLSQQPRIPEDRSHDAHEVGGKRVSETVVNPSDIL